MLVCVVGVGNIGCNLLLSLRAAGLKAVGVDTSESRVRELKEQQITGIHGTSGSVGEPDVWIIATSTGPNLTYLMSAAASITPKPGALISVESTLPMGGMSRLQAEFADRGYVAGQGFHLVHVPHRILFGVEQSVFDAPRVIAGATPGCLEQGIAFYRPLVPQLFPVSDLRTAEMSKVVENSLRFVEIAFAEELFRYCQANGLDFRELRGAVNTKGNVRLLDVDYGIGGECLPKDIRFLQEALNSDLVAGAIRAEAEFGESLCAQAAGHRRILIHGLTFKPGHPDTRFSRPLDLARALVAGGKEVFVYDPLLTPDQVAGLGFQWGDPAGDYDLIYERPLRITPVSKWPKTDRRSVYHV